MDQFGAAYPIYDPSYEVPGVYAHQHMSTANVGAYPGQHSMSVYVPPGQRTEPVPPTWATPSRQFPAQTNSFRSPMGGVYDYTQPTMDPFGGAYGSGPIDPSMMTGGDGSTDAFWRGGAGVTLGQESQVVYSSGPIRFQTPMDLSGNQSFRSSGKGPSGGTPRGRGGSRMPFAPRRGGSFGATQERRPTLSLYCDVCKISCAGPKAFAEHQGGQRHKKRLTQDAALERLKNSVGSETLAKTTNSSSTKSCELTCTLCGVKCTGADAYSAHLSGKGHQRAVKLHQKMGKPIPEPEPLPVTIQPVEEPAKKEEIKQTEKPEEAPVINGNKSNKVTSNGHPAVVTKPSNSPDKSAIPKVQSVQDDRKAVGEEYVVQIPGPGGKGTHYNCNLCACQFTHEDAKQWHLKGRRHRVQYKKQVDPNLVIEPKSGGAPNNKKATSNDHQNERNIIPPMPSADVLPRGGLNFSLHDNRAFSTPRFPLPSIPTNVGGGGGGGGFYRPPQTIPFNSVAENRYIQTKHSKIVPIDIEVKAMRTVVSICEHSLKNISNELMDKTDSTPTKNGTMEKSSKPNGDTETSKSADQAKTTSSTNGPAASANAPANEEDRLLRGVVRIGSLGKSLLLRGDCEGGLVLVCAEWPTTKVVEYIAAQLTKGLTAMDANFSYTLITKPNEGRITVNASRVALESDDAKWPTIAIHVDLTSVVVIDTPPATTPPVPSDTNQNEDTTMKKTDEDSVASSAVGADTSVTSSTTPNGAALTTAPEQPTVNRAAAAAAAANAGTRSHGRQLFDQGERVSKKHCLSALDAIDQAKWFQALLAFLDHLLAMEYNMMSPPMRPGPRPPFMPGGGALPPGNAQAPGPFPGMPRSRAPQLPPQPSVPPARLFRQFFEAIASGLLLQLTKKGEETTPKADETTTSSNTTTPPSPSQAPPQPRFFGYAMLAITAMDAREKITVSAQHCLRLIAFKKLYQVLGMPQFQPQQASSKTPTAVAEVAATPIVVDGVDEVVGGAKRRRTDDETLATEEDVSVSIIAETVPVDTSTTDAELISVGSSSEGDVTEVVPPTEETSAPGGEQPSPACRTRSAKRTRRGR